MTGGKLRDPFFFYFWDKKVDLASLLFINLTAVVIHNWSWRGNVLHFMIVTERRGDK